MAECPCAEPKGCPSCVQHLDCKNYNAVLSKAAAQLVLRELLAAERAYAAAARTAAAAGQRQAGGGGGGVQAGLESQEGAGVAVQAGGGGGVAVPAEVVSALEAAGGPLVGEEDLNNAMM